MSDENERGRSRNKNKNHHGNRRDVSSDPFMRNKNHNKKSHQITVGHWIYKCGYANRIYRTFDAKEQVRVGLAEYYGKYSHQILK